MKTGRNRGNNLPQSGSRFLREIQNQNNYFSPNISGYQSPKMNSKSKLRLKSSNQRMGLKLSRNSSYHRGSSGKYSPSSSNKYFNQENIGRVNQGYYSPQINAKKSSSNYLQNFQRLMGNRSPQRNITNTSSHSNGGSPNSTSKRLHSMKSSRKKTPQKSLMDKMNSSYGYGSGNMNGSLHLNTSNSSYRNNHRQSHSSKMIGVKYPSSHRINNKKQEYAEQIRQIAQIRQLGKFDFRKMESSSRTNSPGIATQYKQMKMDSYHKGSPERAKYKSPKRKTPCSKISRKRTSSSKKINKSASRGLEKRAVLRKGSLGLIEQYQKRFSSQNSSINTNAGEKYLLSTRLNPEQRERSFGQYHATAENGISKYSLTQKVSQNLIIGTNNRGNSSPKLSKQKLKLRNVLSQQNKHKSPFRNQSHKIKKGLNSKWSKSRDRSSLNSINPYNTSVNSTAGVSVQRTPRVSKSGLKRNQSTKESPIRIGGNGSTLLGKIYRRNSKQQLEAMKRKQSASSSIGLNLVPSVTRNTNRRNSNIIKESSQQSQFNTGLKLYSKKKPSVSSSRKRLSSSNYSKASATESNNSSRNEFQQLSSHKCVEKIVNINNYKKEQNQALNMNESNLVKANTHHFNSNILKQRQGIQPGNLLSRKLTPFNLTHKIGNTIKTNIFSQKNTTQTQENRRLSQETSQRNSSKNVSMSPTIKISSKRNLLNDSSNSQNSTSKSRSISEITKKTTSSKEKYSKFYKIVPQQYSKFKDLTFIEKCGYQLYCINKALKVNKDVYDMIRIYADHAQEIEFNKMSSIFKEKQASNLFSRIMKLERWAITLVFYFQVEPLRRHDADNMVTVMKNLVEEIWKNHNNLVNWIKILNKEYKLKWILNDLNRIYWDVNLDMTRLIIHIKSCVRVITGLLQQMNSYLSIQHQQFQEVFFENLDNWSVIKCFEKGFECFYQSLSKKGVISVNKNNSPKQSNSLNRVGPGKENMHLLNSKTYQMKMQNYQELAKNNNIPKLPLTNVRYPGNKENAKVQTPKKKYNTSIIEEVDEELQKTERKSIGDKSEESNKSKKKNIENNVTPNLNSTKHPKKHTSKKNENERNTNENELLNTSEKKRIDKHLEEEEKDAIEIMKAARKIENVPFFLFQPDTNQMNSNRSLLPAIKEDRVYTLVLDLDETLVHFQEQENGKNQFLIRPYAQFFLKEMSKWYEVVIFTAGLKDYADYILDRLDTQKWITHRLYRRHCDPQGTVFQKDLSKLGRDLSKTLIVDNSAENFQLQPDNGIYIKSWYDDPDDKALPQLAPLLIDIVKKNYADVRVAMRKLGEKMMEQYNANPQKPIFELSLEPQDSKDSDN